VRMLLDRGAEPGRRSASGSTPLALAEEKGHEQAARVLRSAGAG
jgi:ankyrin repeat protein